jgi:uncharacterized membrane protein
LDKFNLSKEAVLVITTTTGFIGSIMTLLVAFGIDFSDEQRNAIIGTAVSFLVLIFVIGPIIRAFVWSKNSVRVVAEKAAKTGDVPIEVAK